MQNKKVINGLYVDHRGEQGSNCNSHQRLCLIECPPYGFKNHSVCFNNWNFQTRFCVSHNIVLLLFIIYLSLLLLLLIRQTLSLEVGNPGVGLVTPNSDEITVSKRFIDITGSRMPYMHLFGLYKENTWFGSKCRWHSQSCWYLNRNRSLSHWHVSRKPVSVSWIHKNNQGTDNLISHHTFFDIENQYPWGIWTNIESTSTQWWH